MAGYRAEFLKLFGFGLPGVDYEAEAEARSRRCLRRWHSGN